MNKQDPEIQINPDVLRWVREGSGWEIEELSMKTRINSESILKWEASSTAVKVSDLRKISEMINRPLSVLLLPEPPKEKVLTDYRKIYGHVRKKLSKKTLAAIRNARYVQSNASELLELRSEDARPNITFRTLDDDPRAEAATEMDALGIELEMPRRKDDRNRFGHAAYLNLKEKIESLNIFVMQVAMDVDEISGFALANIYPMVVLVNSSNNIQSQFFSLLHGYAHLLLKTDGICLINSDPFKKRSSARDASIEVWCNDFADAAIDSMETAFKQPNNKADRESEMAVSATPNRFKRKKMPAFLVPANIFPLRYIAGVKSGIRNKAQECVNCNGKRYVKLVLDSKSRNLITIGDMIRYLDLNTTCIEELDDLI